FKWKYKRLFYGVHRYPKGQFWLYPFVHAFICVSTVVAKALQSELGSGTKVYTIVNPIDDRVFNSAKERNPVKGRVLYAGRVHSAKGLLCLAKACKSLYEHGECCELVLVGVCDKSKGGGGAEFLEELHGVAAPCPMKETGAISDSYKLADIERTADVFVYPSEDAIGEACPIAPMEAMALGVPTVVSDMNCYDDYVVDKVNAIRFKTGDMDDLVQKISGLMDGSEDARRLGSEATKSMEKYSVSNVAEKYLDIFRTV
ncbi:MAG: glycosyltransferase family 4 protein, partial [bacterium]|nr:glycosyltransferase family 4 protein [bacterium]